MAAMSSNEITPIIGQLLLIQARQSLIVAAEKKELLKIDLAQYPAAIQQIGATFVTLEKKGDLRGCIGSLEAREPLVIDVINNAYQAALFDPRFYPVQSQEVSLLRVSISILSKAMPLQFTSEADLLQQIRPEIDGLIFEAYGHRGTFLPAVWESLHDPVLFLQHLKQKAGFPADFWDENVHVSRYTADKFSEH
jgi:AmmeMemoRadiSam system protein A